MATEHVLFEDAGQFKAGTVVQDSGQGLQVESTSGKRLKVKPASVMLRFAQPSAAELMTQAQAMAEDIDLDFLWECAPQDEFGFQDLAAEYFGTERSSVQDAALLLRLHASPVYFYRKGKGRYRPAQAETLKAALAAVERRRQQDLLVDALAQKLVAGELPEEIAAIRVHALIAKDRQSVPLRAVDAACASTGESPSRLMLRVKAFPNEQVLLRERFLHEQFSGGRIEFPAQLVEGFRVIDLDQLPDAGVAAFSTDDRTTTEIDDCLSVQQLDEGMIRVGIHIAAPAWSITRDSRLDLAARDRLTTVYSPGEKITMLPEEVVRAFSLDEGTTRPAASLYLDVRTEDWHIVSQFSRIDRVHIDANLRHNDLDEVVTEEALNAGTLTGVPHADAILALWRFTEVLSAERDRIRGRPEPRFRVDFNFYVEDGHVEIIRRRRDAPMDRIVAEMAILANSSWGRLLADHGVPGLYRAQAPFGRVRMTTHPAEHQGIGVPQYAWSSSPLRRYVDLVNQMQLMAVLEGSEPAFERNDAELLAIISSFEAKNTAVNDYQSMMERYWCLRWVAQRVEKTGERQFEAVATREDSVRLMEAPLYFRLPGMPPMVPGQRVLTEILDWDELDLTVHARGLRLIAGVDDSEGPEVVDAPSEHPVGGLIDGVGGGSTEGAPPPP